MIQTLKNGVKVERYAFDQPVKGKPHIIFRKGWWRAKTHDGSGKARKPKTAYNAWVRYMKAPSWIRERQYART